MPTVQDYVSENILSLIKKGFRLFGYFKTPILGPIVKKYGSKELKKCEPKKVSVDYASKLIQKSNNCAVGQRVCNILNAGADLGESVFLDELAVGLVHAGKANYVQKGEAIKTIAHNRKGPIMITKVSGKYMEICRAIPKNCIYWNSEKHGLKCVERYTQR